MRTLTWEQVSSWRLARGGLSAAGAAANAPDAARAMCGIHAQVISAGELALAVRVPKLARDAVGDLLWSKRLLAKTWAMRGTLHLLAADDPPAFTGAAAATKHQHTQGAWLRFHELTAKDVAALLDAIPVALDGACLTREELAAEVARIAKRPALREKLRSGWGSLLKPAANQALLCFGPNRGRNVTFVRPDQWLRSWKPVDGETALRAIARRYLGVYGPARHTDFARWWGVPPPPARRVWKELADDLVEVDVEGWRAHTLSEHADAIAATRRPRAQPVHLLPAFDPYVVGVAARDRILAGVPKARVSRAAGWISPVVLHGGRIVGVWSYAAANKLELDVELLGVEWRDVEPAVRTAASRLARFLGVEAHLTLR